MPKSSNQNQQTLDANPGDTYEQLLNKVKSKMEVAKFFTGFISIVIGLSFDRLIKEGADQLTEAGFWVAGMLAMIISLIFSIVTMFAYDRLLMPTFYLGPREPLRDINQKIYDRMGAAWQNLFIPSMILLVVGIILCLVAKLGIYSWCKERLAVIFSLLAFGIVIPVFIYRKTKVQFANFSDT